ncbi:MAG: GntR family transcriptional regulator, partial [Oscillospiraceae bacterium]
MLSVGKQTVSDEVLSRLMSDIENKTLKLGDKIPSEKELCEKYNVSRVSVRSAIQKLQAQSFVRTYPGKGTYVISDTVQNAGIMGQIEMSREEYLYFIELRQALEFKSV